MYVGIAVGGFAGAVVRFWIGGRLGRGFGTVFPVGTMVINVSGSLLLGLLTGWSLGGGVPSAWRSTLGTGFLGAYTTFSTWNLETVRLVESGRWRLAGMNVLLSTAAGLGAAWIGLHLGQGVAP